MSIASDGRPVWESDAGEPLRPHTSVPHSGDEHQRLLARQMDDAHAAAAAAAAQTGRRPPRLGPQLQPADIPLVTRLADEIFCEARGRGRFAALPVGKFADAATILFRYRIRSLGILRQTQKDARAVFMRDLREFGRRSFPETQLLLQILGHFPPRRPHVRLKAKGPAYEEIAIAERLSEFAASLSGIGSPPKPTQERDNYISLELSRGRSKLPAYAPFVVPDVSAAPWAITSKDHQAAVTRRRTSSRQAKREDNPQSIPMQAWLLYQMRFLIAADLACAWSGFCGLAAQLNRLAIVMNISLTDSAAVAMPYGRLVREFLAGRARSRHGNTIGGNFRGDVLSVWNPA